MVHGAGKGGRREQRHHSSRNKISIGDKGKEVLEKIDDDNPVLKQFRCYAAELDERHDRFERITKISRDILIESKRIIFLLHSIDRPSKQETILGQAKARLNNLSQTCFKVIATELKNQDAYHYLRAYRAGLEEYVEAVTFYQYLSGGSTEDWADLQSSFTYDQTDCNAKEQDTSGRSEGETEEIRALVTPYDYILGLGDLTGELMRRCINDLATGDISSCYKTCNFVRHVYKGFLGCSSLQNKEIGRKLFTLRQNLHKIENVCYTIKVRGSEIPKHMLVNAAIVAAENCNEAFDL